MTLNRYARKTDTAQLQIVEDLRKAGVVVVIISKPVDLMVRLNSWPPNRWACIEIKTPRKSGSIALDKRQREQIAFCADYDVPKLTTTEQVIAYLGALR